MDSIPSANLRQQKLEQQRQLLEQKQKQKRQQQVGVVAKKCGGILEINNSCVLRLRPTNAKATLYFPFRHLFTYPFNVSLTQHTKKEQEQT